MSNTGLMGVLVAAVIAFGNAVNAGVIYENGGPSGSGNEVTQWIQAEDFRLENDARIEGVGAYIGFQYTDLSDWDGTVEYWIYSDASGPDSVLAEGEGQNASFTQLDFPWAGADTLIYLLEFDFEAAFDALADTTYWLVIHLSADYDRDEIYWMRTLLNGTATGKESHYGTEAWRNNFSEHAFYLTGEMAEPNDPNEPNDPVETPAPAGLALLGLGLVALGRARRRA